MPLSMLPHVQTITPDVVDGIIDNDTCTDEHDVVRIIGIDPSIDDNDDAINPSNILKEVVNGEVFSDEFVQVMNCMSIMRSVFFVRHKIGIREFAHRAGISRKRMARIIDDLKMPTTDEMLGIGNAISYYEDKLDDATVPKEESKVTAPIVAIKMPNPLINDAVAKAIKLPAKYRRK